MEKKIYVAVKALVCYGRKFLLIKRTTEARGDYYHWEFPGGRLEFGESPMQALKREINEETGLEVEKLILLNAWNSFKDECTEIIGLTYICTANGDNVMLSKEHSDYEWVTYEEMNDYNLVKGMSRQLEELNRNYINKYINDNIRRSL
ncbi:NUDIX hydrolase [Eubacterium sp. Marseille-QA0814]|uniref:NUDIX hydrolase n=1 Tax=Eubacterium sp. Marseille-QA0814 TaxID=3378778 RepID=UPI003D0ECBBA